MVGVADIGHGEEWDEVIRQYCVVRAFEGVFFFLIE